MKLTDMQIEQIKDQLGANPVPPVSPTADLLTKHFGDHTFFIDDHGLHIFEMEHIDEGSGPMVVHPVRVASWAGEAKDALVPHDPIVRPATVTIQYEN